MLAKILADNSIAFARDRLLNPDQPIMIETSVDNGMVADIMINVRDAANHDLAVSNNGDALSTGDFNDGVIRVPFNLGVLAEPRYVIWNTWVIYSGPAQPTPVPFTVTVTVKQGGTVYLSSVTAEVAPGDSIVGVKVDGLWTGEPL